ncbi:hypothetical protein TNCV_1108011 [Trichonephila clavipes]|nr:hypothetical protein TNCV_1108011 [Trichonephila clavipes]
MRKLLYKRNNLLQVLAASTTRFFQFQRNAATLCQFLIFRVFKSFSTTSIHLVGGLPLVRDPIGFLNVNAKGTAFEREDSTLVDRWSSVEDRAFPDNRADAGKGGGEAIFGRSRNSNDRIDTDDYLLFVAYLRKYMNKVVLFWKKARAMKVARFNETFPQAELRRLEQAKREAADRASETPERPQARRRRHAEYLASKRAAETPEQSQARRLQHATYMASQRDTETIEERAAESRKRAVAERAQQRRLIFTKNT